MTSRFIRALCLCAVVLIEPATEAPAQRARATPTMLPAPAGWRFERLPIPPGFARDITWTGYEEARFSPGMFDTTSPDHFTYALSICIDGIVPVQAADLKGFLEKYFKGLSLGIGRGKGLTLDASQFHVEVAERKTDPPARGKFTAKVVCFDSFNDGRKITLNLEADARPLEVARKTMLVLLISPQAFDAPVWKQLHAIRESAQEPR